MGLQCPNRLRSGFLGRIKKCKVSHQNHIALVLDAVCISGRKRPFLRNGDYAHPVLIQIGYCFQNCLPNLIGKWLHLSLIFRMRTDGEHFFYGTLGNHLPFPAGILYHRWKAAPGEVKRNLVYLVVNCGEIGQLVIGRFFLLCPLNNRYIHQIFISGLEVAIQVRMS